MKPFRALLLLLSFWAEETTCSLQRQKLYEFQTKLQERTAPIPIIAATPMASYVSPNAKKRKGRVFYPIGYGADPSGAQDSSDAMLGALGDAFQVEINGGLELLPGIRDLGGVVIDLQGGNFRISKPIRFPSGVGNVLVQRGSLRASDTFPGDRHLIELWSPNSQPLKKTYSDGFSSRSDQNSDIYYEDITFRDVLFDSSFRGGGLFAIDAVRIRINNCFFIHFTTDGILVHGGHETFISSCFLGQHSTVGGDRSERDFSGTAIDLASNDNAVTDVAIFSAATGVILRGQANMLTGVHCYNKATSFGGAGIVVKAGQTRISNCYLDFNSIVIEDPFQVLVSNGFFLGDGNIVLKANKGQISGLSIVNNMFSGDPEKMVPIVKLEGRFTKVDQVVIDHNNVNGMRLKSTVGKATLPGNGTRWVADLSSVLVFPSRINHVQYSFYVGKGEGVAGFPAHAVTDVSDNAVVVESDRAVSAVVSVVVDQHNMVGERNFLM